MLIEYCRIRAVVFSSLFSRLFMLSCSFFRLAFYFDSTTLSESKKGGSSSRSTSVAEVEGQLHLPAVPLFFPPQASPGSMTTRYTRLNSLDAISHAFQPPPKPSPWSGLRSLASSPRHLAVLLAVVSVLGLGYILSGSEGTAVVGLGWATGRYGAERTYARLMENTLQVRLPSTTAVSRADADNSNVQHVTPQMSWKDQMVEGRQFLTAMMFGGQSNQLLGMYNLLYMGKELGRTVILCV